VGLKKKVQVQRDKQTQQKKDYRRKFGGQELRVVVRMDRGGKQTKFLFLQRKISEGKRGAKKAEEKPKGADSQKKGLRSV